MHKLLIFGSSWMYQASSPHWEIYSNTQETDPRFSTSPKFSQGYVDEIKRVDPDFVLSINIGCSESLFDQMEKPKGPKYITWSTDSYRHTCRCQTSDLHLSSIPDESLTDSDAFVPLFFEWHEPPLALEQRPHKIGLHCRPWKCDQGYRQDRIRELKSLLGSDFLLNQNEMPAFDYIQELRSFKYGLNIGVYRDGLPNFRSFEFGACGVLPISDSINRGVLENLFEDHIIIYDKPEEIPMLLREYDPIEVQRFYNEKHSLNARLKHIFETYFDLRY